MPSPAGRGICPLRSTALRQMMLRCAPAKWCDVVMGSCSRKNNRSKAITTSDCFHEIVVWHNQILANNAIWSFFPNQIHKHFEGGHERTSSDHQRLCWFKSRWRNVELRDESTCAVTTKRLFVQVNQACDVTLVAMYTGKQITHDRGRISLSSEKLLHCPSLLSIPTDNSRVSVKAKKRTLALHLPANIYELARNN